MKNLGIPGIVLLLTFAAAACRSEGDYDDDTTPTTMSPSPGDGGYRSAPNYEARENVAQRNAAMAAEKGESSGRALSSDDREFVAKAVQGGMFEVRSSTLALEKNTSGATREFAQMMIDDHGKANRDLERLVQKKGVRTANDLDDEHQQKLDRLAELEGREFERKYHEAQVKAHDKAIDLFERGSRECDDQDLRAFANRLLPTLRAHRRHLDEHPLN